MTEDEIKDTAVSVLSGRIDSVIAAAQAAFLAHKLVTVVSRVDYVAQLIVLEFTEKQPTSDQLDDIGAALRKSWPQMPDITATLFKMSKHNTKVFLDLNTPSGVATLANEGDVNALAALSKQEYLPVIDYRVRPGQEPQRSEGMLQVHEQRL